MKKKKLSKALAVVLILGAVFIWQAVFTQVGSQSPLLEVNFLDVGEGDSILVEIPPNNQVLIDGGPSRGVVEKVAKEMPFFDKKIELVILTHPDKDHITGLFEVLETFKVDRILMPEIIGEKKEKKLYISFRDLIGKKEIKTTFAKTGQKISFSDGSHFLIFWPEEKFKSKDTNDFSIVAKLSFGDMKFLFTGDAPQEIEYQLLAKNFDLESEILKVGHHGSKYSTDEYFLKEVSPEVAVISVGENSYGHPAQEVLDNLQKYDITIYRTDKNGDIKIISDGKNYQVETER